MDDICKSVEARWNDDDLVGVLRDFNVESGQCHSSTALSSIAERAILED